MLWMFESRPPFTMLQSLVEQEKQEDGAEAGTLLAQDGADGEVRSKEE